MSDSINSPRITPPAQPDVYAGHAPQMWSPAEFHKAITPNDTTILNPRPRSIRINVAGTVVVSCVDPSDLTGATFTDITYNCVAGEVLRIRPHKIKATGTSASGIVSWW